MSRRSSAREVVTGSSRKVGGRPGPGSPPERTRRPTGSRHPMEPPHPTSLPRKCVQSVMVSTPELKRFVAIVAGFGVNGPYSVMAWAAGRRPAVPARLPVAPGELNPPDAPPSCSRGPSQPRIPGISSDGALDTPGRERAPLPEPAACGPDHSLRLSAGSLPQRAGSLHPGFGPFRGSVILAPHRTS
jgi:hypothetical protein